MGLFHRKPEDPAIKVARERAKRDIEQSKIEEAIGREEHKAERERQLAENRIANIKAHEAAYDVERTKAATAKGAAKGQQDAASVGRTPGMRIIHGAAGVIRAAQKASGGGPQHQHTVVRTEEVVGGKKIVTERHYGPPARGGGGAGIPAFRMPGAGQARRPPPRPAAAPRRTILVKTGPNTYEERQVGGAPAQAAPRPRPRQTVPGLAVPALTTAPALSGYGMAGPPKKKGKTGIAILDNPW